MSNLSTQHALIRTKTRSVMWPRIAPTSVGRFLDIGGRDSEREVRGFGKIPSVPRFPSVHQSGECSVARMRQRQEALAFARSRPWLSKPITKTSSPVTTMKQPSKALRQHCHMCELQFQQESCQCQCPNLCAGSVCFLSCLTKALASSPNLSGRTRV